MAGNLGSLVPTPRAGIGSSRQGRCAGPDRGAVLVQGTSSPPVADLPRASDDPFVHARHGAVMLGRAVNRGDRT
jgi:hypothetical protein